VIGTIRGEAGSLVWRLTKLWERLCQFRQELSGLVLDFRVNTLRQRLVFQDEFGFLYWLYPGDEVRLNCQRRNVLDSVGVVHFILHRTKRSDICIDIGAASGAVSVPLMAQCKSTGIVISVEADPAKIARIKANLELNHMPSKYVVNAAISDRVEVREFRVFPDAPGWSTFGDPPFARAHDSHLVSVNCMDFVSLAEQYNLQHIDLVKIDVEGAEILVLTGMLPWLLEGRIRCVIFEVNPLMLPGLSGSVDELLLMWQNLPYRLFRLTETGQLLALGTSWPTNQVGDCVAILEDQPG